MTTERQGQEDFVTWGWSDIFHPTSVHVDIIIIFMHIVYYYIACHKMWVKSRNKGYSKGASGHLLCQCMYWPQMYVIQQATTMLRATMLYGTMLYGTMLCATMLCATMLRATMLRATMLRATMLWMAIYLTSAHVITEE